MKRRTGYRVRIPLKHGGALETFFLQQPSSEHIIEAFHLEGDTAGAEIAKRIRSWVAYGKVRECPFQILPTEFISIEDGE